jgi:hypothetical protein
MDQFVMRLTSSVGDAAWCDLCFDELLIEKLLVAVCYSSNLKENNKKCVGAEYK